MVSTVDVVEEEADLSTPARRRGSSIWRRVRQGPVLVLLLVVPVYAIVRLVRSGTRMQWFDYWFALTRFTNPDGSLAPRGLFSFNNEHLPVLPGLVYWINVHLTGGSNIALGLLDVVLVLVQVAILATILPPWRTMGRWKWSLVLLAAGTLMFSPSGASNSARGGSGIAWLMANMLALAAIALAHRRHYLLGHPVRARGHAAPTGTGLMAWPALVLLAVLATVLGERWTWRRGRS